ncbi:MAG: PQQ-binding-like beta-propeller repeat protein [Thaumarchaeota archaeon]|nr:PQQ-binding-like beta-propeller repeat protein [Nitrososphaerota archaeon]
MTAGPLTRNFGRSVPYPTPKNTAIYAVDAVSGKQKWSYFIPTVAFMGGIVASGGVVYSAAADGQLYILDADTGKFIQKKFFGVALGTQPTLG